MSARTLRRLAVVEPVAVFALIMAYIWQLRYSHPRLCLASLAVIVLSHVARRESTDALGFHRYHLRECLQEFAPLLALFALAMLGAGMLLQTTRPIRFGDAFLAWAAYVPWGAFQQYLLNGYFLNRF